MGKSLQPTRKWWVAQITAMAALLVAWVNVGAWNRTVTIGLIGFASQAVTSYLTPNHDVPGGVALRKPASRRRARQHLRGKAVSSRRATLEDATA
jgi:hypothetical protein